MLLLCCGRAQVKHQFSLGKAIVDTGSINIDPGTSYQVIHSFGASDCWTAKFAGNWKNEKKKDAIADLLFSTANGADGSPKGIGLSLWRFNIGAGTYEQGDASGIPDEYRREECFLGPGGKYDWRKQSGAQWFLRAAKKRGVRYLLAVTNSAPVQFTKNGLGYGLSSNDLSCKEENYADFSNFLVKVTKHFQEAGTPFNFISPVNEPQWQWGEHPAQEGSGARNSETAKLLRLLGPAIKAAGLATTITASEAAQVNFLYGSNENHTGNQLDDFFNPASENYIGNIPNTEKLLSYHSYFTTCPDTTLFRYRTAVNEKRKAVDPALQLWQSEFGVLGNICNQLNGGPRYTGIDYGLYVARVMYADLALAGVSSFQWWLAINPYDYSDGLVYINAPDGSINPAKSKDDGMVSSSKQLWCMGNYSRFIRPGMRRVAVGFSGGNVLLVSAYTDSINRQVVTVVVNASAQQWSIQLNATGRKLNPKTATYTTSASQDLQYQPGLTSNVMIKPMSVTTLVTKFE